MRSVDKFFTRKIPDKRNVQQSSSNIGGMKDSWNGQPLVKGAYRFTPPTGRPSYFNPSTVAHLTTEHRGDPTVLFVDPVSKQPVRRRYLVRLVGRQSEPPEVLAAFFR